MQNPFHHVLTAPRLLALLALAGAGLSAASCTGDGESVGAASSAEISADTATPEQAQATPAAGLFSVPEPWTRRVEGDAKSASSDAITGWLADHGGWGTRRLRIEFSIKVLHADASTPFREFSPTDDFYTPDCDHVPFPMPIGGALEDESGYECTTDGDCHLLVVHEPSHKLYEMWRANVSGGQFRGGCAAVWDLDRSYAEHGRGENCTSSDAGGLPVAAMVFTADEVARGSIDHAVRFILPNARIRRKTYVHPATHASDALTGGPDAPPYGVRLRLRADYPLETLPTDGARVLARALQRYGMILADGGHVPLTAADDRDSVHKWSEVGVGPDSVGAIGVKDMEVVDMEEPRRSTGDCERN